MKLLIAIATYKRIQKLQRCLDSISKGTYRDVNIVVIADNNDIESKEFVSSYSLGGINTLVQPGHKFVIGAWNRAVKEIFIPGNYDGFIGLCDDVELHPDALTQVVRELIFTCGGTDGVVGFNQECPEHSEYTFKWFGQTLMGRNFIERYKEANYQICCPDYKHFFQDEEMFEYAKSQRCFVQCPEAILYHYHPGFIKEEHDETHDIIRKGKQSPKFHDILMQGYRKNKGYLWGRDFNLIGDTK